MTWLLDSNVLIALSWPKHPFHQRASHWFTGIGEDRFATCPVTEGSLLRLRMRFAVDKSPIAAWGTLNAFQEHPKHIFWPDNFSYTEIDPQRLTGHNQVTDAWLAELAKRKGGKLATLDEPLSALWPESAFLIPV